MKCNILLLLFLTTTKLLFSQGEELVMPFFNNGKWGYMNQSKDIVICPSFEEAYPPSNRLAKFKEDGKYGYINQRGKIVIKPRYDEAADFRYGIARVRKRKKVYNIKTNGERNLEMVGVCGYHNGCFNYDQSPDFSEIIIADKAENLDVVLKKYYRDDQNKVRYTLDTIRTDFDSIQPISHRLMYFVKGNKIAFIYRRDFWKHGIDTPLDKLKFVYEDVDFFNCNNCSDGTHEIIGVRKNGLWGYRKINDIEKDYIEFKYYSISSLAGNYALVEYDRGKFGYIDWRGKEYFFR